MRSFAPHSFNVRLHHEYIVMLKIVIASIVSPNIFPWIAWPATNTAFRALSYGELSWHWAIRDSVQNYQQYVLYGYLLMFLVFIPLLLLLKRLHWYSWWNFCAAGVVFGHLSFSLLVSIPSFITKPRTLFDFFSSLVEAPGGLINIFWVPEITHVQLGTTFSAGVMMLCFWVIGVRGNIWVTKQSNTALNPA